MANSGTFDSDHGALAPHSDEFLAGVLALARISRVTVALESGANGGSALLAAARLTGHAETCLLFDKWNDAPLSGLRSLIAHAGGDEAAVDNGTGSLRDLLHAIQARRHHSFLLILNHFDRLLAMPADDPAYQSFEQAFVELADDRELDLHMLIVLDEAQEDLLARMEQRIPGIGDGCLRISPSSTAGSAAAGPPRAALTGTYPNGTGTTRDRSFGRLLERLTTIAPADNLQPPQDSALPNPASPSGSSRPTADDSAPFIQNHLPERPHETEAAQPQGMPLHANVSEASQVAPLAPAEDATAVPGKERVGVEEPAGLPEAAYLDTKNASQPAASHGQVRAWATALVLLVAVGAGVFALWRPTPSPTLTQTAESAPQQAVSPPKAAATAVPDAFAQPAGTSREQIANLGPALAPSAAISEPQAAPSTSGSAAISASSPAPSVSAPVTVYVHVRDGRERDRVQSQVQKLAGQGIRLMDIKITNHGPSVPDLRYFHDEDRAEALTLQKALLAAGVPVSKLSRMTGFESTARRRHFEAWLNGSASQPGASQR